MHIARSEEKKLQPGSLYPLAIGDCPTVPGFPTQPSLGIPNTPSNDLLIALSGSLDLHRLDFPLELFLYPNELPNYNPYTPDQLFRINQSVSDFVYDHFHKGISALRFIQIRDDHHKDITSQFIPLLNKYLTESQNFCFDFLHGRVWDGQRRFLLKQRGLELDSFLRDYCGWPRRVKTYEMNTNPCLEMSGRK